jgi:hypothetical protein
MRKVSVFVAVCTLAIACVVMAGSSVSGYALNLASVSSAATETAAPARVSSDDQQLSAPGITPPRRRRPRQKQRPCRPMLHGIVYDLHVGLLKQLVLQVDGQDKVRALLEADRRGVGV